MARAGLLALARRLFGIASWEQARKIFLDSAEGKIGYSSATLHANLPSTSPIDPTPLKSLLQKRCPDFSHGGALGTSMFVKQLSALLPARTRHWHSPKPDALIALGLTSPFGIRTPA